MVNSAYRNKSVDVTLDGVDFEARIDEPETIKSGLLLLPGISSGPYGGIFDKFTEATVEEDILVMRYESWENIEELQEKTMNSIFKEIEDAVNYLSNQVNKVYIVAKSFSAGMILAGRIDNFEKLVLWSPAVKFDNHSNIESLRGELLGRVEDVTDIRINSDFLSLNAPTKIIHGNKDEIISLENSEEIANNLPNCKLFEISGTGHSYKEKEDLVIEETIKFLNN